MKKLVVLMMVLVFSLVFTGCGTVKIATDIGSSIGKSYQVAAAKGTITAEQSIEAWPYASGVIKGLMADDYNLALSPMSTNIIDKLDALALKDDLTTEDKGLIIGYFVRLEIIAIKDNWDNYGVSIFGLVTKSIGL